MSSPGVMVGIGLLVAVTVVSWWLGRLANRGVREFREDHHETFVGRGPL